VVFAPSGAGIKEDVRMAWPFSGNSGGTKSADQHLSEERLKILANVAIEQVPFPE